jgi:hypothetical protein
VRGYNLFWQNCHWGRSPQVISDITDPALQQLAEIIRGADTSRLDLTPQSAGLYAISLGLSRNFPNDHDMLKHGMVIYEALYAWCKDGQKESHDWPPKM